MLSYVVYNLGYCLNYTVIIYHILSTVYVVIEEAFYIQRYSDFMSFAINRTAKLFNYCSHLLTYKQNKFNLVQKYRGFENFLLFWTRSYYHSYSMLLSIIKRVGH